MSLEYEDRDYINTHFDIIKKLTCDKCLIRSGSDNICMCCLCYDFIHSICNDCHTIKLTYKNETHNICQTCYENFEVLDKNTLNKLKKGIARLKWNHTQ